MATSSLYLPSCNSVCRRAAARSRTPHTCLRRVLAPAAPSSSSNVVPFPRTYAELAQQCGDALAAARADGILLQEVQFPPGGLASTPGDVEGNVESDLTVTYTAQVLRRAFPGDALGAVTVYLPDKEELSRAAAALSGLPCATTWLCQGGLATTTGFSRLGLFGVQHPSASLRGRANDTASVVLYPSHNLDELVAVSELHDDTAAAGRPVVVVNGEMDRIRSGYYPAFWAFREMDILRKFTPRFEAVYFIHNFKGSVPCVLFRAYPGPFQVLCGSTEQGFTTLATLETFPGLQAVARDIIPAALSARRKAAASQPPG